MKNTHLHEPCWTNHPPSTGPIAAVIDGEAGPRPDRAPPLLLGKISADESQAAGHKQRPANSLETPRNNKLPDVGRESAPGRGYGEEHDTGREDLAAAVQVS